MPAFRSFRYPFLFKNVHRRARYLNDSLPGSRRRYPLPMILLRAFLRPPSLRFGSSPPVSSRSIGGQIHALLLRRSAQKARTGNRRIFGFTACLSVRASVAIRLCFAPLWGYFRAPRAAFRPARPSNPATPANKSPQGAVLTGRPIGHPVFLRLPPPFPRKILLRNHFCNGTDADMKKALPDGRACVLGRFMDASSV